VLKWHFKKNLKKIKLGKVGRVASEEIILQLIKSKSLQILLYCLQVCPLTQNDINSLDFVMQCKNITVFVK